jgi:hypothetical protein
MAVERQMELRRRYHRKKKMAKLKKKLSTAAGPDREKIIYKIKRLSPWWLEPGTAAPAKKAPVERKAPPKPKAPQRPKSDKPS